LNADLEETKKVTGYNWKGQLKTFLDKKFPNGVTKVLTEMKVPVKYSGVKIEPLVIYWMALSDTDENKCYFKVPVSEFNNPELKTIFQEVHMFSVSLYLRDLRKKIASSILDIDLPNVEKRLAILNSIVLQ
jgi:hypothetical protein